MIKKRLLVTGFRYWRSTRETRKANTKHETRNTANAKSCVTYFYYPTMAYTSSTVRIAGDEKQCMFLREALSSYFSLSQDDQKNVTSADFPTQTFLDKLASESGEEPSIPAKTELSIVNKYFSAKVDLEPLSATGDKKEDGIILCYPSEMKDLDSFLSSIHHRAIGLGAGDLLCLCISIVSGETSEEEYSKRVLWCLDHGYEYIEVNFSKDGLTKGFDLREKDGFPRAIEAIMSTMWSSAVMHSKKKKNISAISETETINKQSTIPISSPSEIPVSDSTNTIKTNTNEPVAKEEKSKSSDEIIEEIMEKEEKETNQEKEKEEQIMDDIERVMHNASRMRELSKSGMISDEKRREQAGDIAMKLMELFDSAFDDDGEDDSDNDDDHEVNQEIETSA